MISYEKALQWQELFDLAVQDKMSEEDLADMAYRIAGMCIPSGMNLSSLVASRGTFIKKTSCRSWTGPLRLLPRCARGRHRICTRKWILRGSENCKSEDVVTSKNKSNIGICGQISLNAMPELIEDVVYPASLEARSQIGEDIQEMREQIRKQVNRLRELRIKKVEEPGQSIQSQIKLVLLTPLRNSLCF